MATIKARRRSDGQIRYTAIVRVRRGKQIVHREAKTFMHRTSAEKWAKTREVALENPAEIARTQLGEVTLNKLIRWYIDAFKALSGWQRTKQAQLEFLEKHPIGRCNALNLTAATLIDHVRVRRTRDRGQ
jgi:hypothetical protein